jgi:glycosidase
VIYSVFLRNHAHGQRFEDLSKDLDRIQALGADWIWLLPFYPIGLKDRKGNFGSPYAIKDYCGVDPIHGDLEDFRALTTKASRLGIKVMIDIVFHHTAPDHPWTKSNPDFYLRKDGEFSRAISDWSDIIDLDFKGRGLQEKLIETLKFWTRLGVQGFRCDVAPMVPMTFWKAARAAVEQEAGPITWLAETLSASWIEDCRRKGILAHSDSDTLEVFDLCYDYFNFEEWARALSARKDLEIFVSRINDELTHRELAKRKLRFTENHDQIRLRARTQVDEKIARAWEVFMALLPGEFLVYAGQEYSSPHHPSLFERDPQKISIDIHGEWIRSLVHFQKNSSRARKLSLSGSQLAMELESGDVIPFVVTDSGLNLHPNTQSKVLSLS